MSFEKVLIIEDEAVVRNILNEIFLRRKCSRRVVGGDPGGVRAEAAISRESFDLILLDIRLAGTETARKFLERLALLPELPLVVVMTGFGSIESAVACMRAGAFDYVMKPFSPGQIDVVLKKAQSHHQLLQVNRYLSDPGDDGDGALDRPEPRRWCACGSSSSGSLRLTPPSSSAAKAGPARR